MERWTSLDLNWEHLNSQDRQALKAGIPRSDHRRAVLSPSAVKTPSRGRWVQLGQEQGTVRRAWDLENQDVI